MTVGPVEIFFNELYYPSLLSDIASQVEGASPPSGVVARGR